MIIKIIMSQLLLFIYAVCLRPLRKFCYVFCIYFFITLFAVALHFLVPPKAKSPAILNKGTS